MLTPKEMEIIVLMCNNVTRVGIAKKLDMSFGLVQVMSTRIYKKLNVKSKAELIALARQRGILND